MKKNSSKIKNLKEDAYEEIEDIRPFIQELVPTYTYKNLLKEKYLKSNKKRKFKKIIRNNRRYVALLKIVSNKIN